MAVTLRNMFSAAVAAMILSLSACGGGQEEVKNPTMEFERAIASEISTGTLEKAAKAPVAKPAIVQSSASGHKASAAAPQAAVAGSVNFTVGGNGKELLSLAAATAPAPTAESFMDWVESSFAELFPGGHQVTIVREGFVFRYYPAGNSFLAVTTAGQVYVWFPSLNPEIKYIAYMCEILDKETCRPVVTSVTPADGAVNVSSEGTVITAKFGEPLDCPPAITGIFGSVKGTLTCAGDVVMITPDATGLPAGLVTATLSSFTSSKGFTMKPHTWSFTVVKPVVVPPVPMVRVVTANIFGDSIGDAGASIVDPATRMIKQVVLDTEPGGCLLPTVVDTDNQRGVAYVGAGACNVLHRVDVKTGTALPSFYIESKYVGSGVHGVAHSTKTGVVCIATGLWGRQTEISFLRNRFICFDPATGQKVFNSANDFLGDATMIPSKAVYSVVHNKYYILVATEGGLIDENLGGGNYRDGYKSGTPGYVVEIDATTYAKGRTWNVGSMPMDAKLLGNILYVLNTGDKSLSKIDLSANATGVVTVSWATTFTGFAYPTNIEIDLEKGVYYVSDWWNSVRVMSLATDQQIGSIVLSGTPRGMGIAGNSLWVVTLALSPGSLSEIDRTTRTVKNVVNNVGDSPFDIAIYDNTKP